MQAILSGNSMRRLSWFDASAVFIGLVVGSGIFFAPSAVLRAAPHPWMALGLWSVGGIIAWCGALTYAECGARLPSNGGFYVVYRHVYGEAIAVIGALIGYGITYPASVAVIALVCAAYTVKCYPDLEGLESIIAITVVGLASLLNMIGVKENALSQKILTLVKVLAITLLCTAALVKTGASASHMQTTNPPFEFDFGVLILATVSILWTYSGWSDITMITGELKKPQSDLGKTVLFSILVLIALYTLVQWAVLSLLPLEEAKASQQVLADAVEAAFGQEAGTLTALIVVISCFGAINSTLLINSRLGERLAQDKHLPAFIAQRHATRHTPINALCISFLCVVMYLLSSPFRQLLGFFTFSVWVFYGLSAIALFKLRQEGVGEPLAWRAPGGGLAPAVVILTAISVTLSIILDPTQRTFAWWGFAFFIASFALYKLRVKQHARLV
jgi:basic amino acid/polyamine antiporter, APA family